MPILRKRMAPSDTLLTIVGINAAVVLCALAIGAILFLPYTDNPFAAYATLVESSLGSWRGIGITLNRAAPLILIGLGTCVAWRSGFGYLGFEGCLTIGAAGAAWYALRPFNAEIAGMAGFLVFLAGAMTVSFGAGGLWAGGVGFLRSRFGGNEVLISLMSNYVAAFFVQYLVSGPMRAEGSLPQTPRFPLGTWLPTILPGTRGQASILIALVAVFFVWLLMRRMRLGYELQATGLNPQAARYGGIQVGARYVLAAFLAGGLGALAGLVEVLGTQHRLLDGLSGGVGFIGIVVALLARLNPLAVVPVAILYAALSVGGDALQRRIGAPTSIIFILQSLIVLFLMASELLRHWTLDLSGLRGKKGTGNV